MKYIDKINYIKSLYRLITNCLRTIMPSVSMVMMYMPGGNISELIVFNGVSNTDAYKIRPVKSEIRRLPIVKVMPRNSMVKEALLGFG